MSSPAKWGISVEAVGTVERVLEATNFASHVVAHQCSLMSSDRRGPMFVIGLRHSHAIVSPAAAVKRAGQLVGAAGLEPATSAL